MQEVQGNGTVGIRPATALQDGAVRGWDGVQAFLSAAGQQASRQRADGLPSAHRNYLQS